MGFFDGLPPPPVAPVPAGPPQPVWMKPDDTIGVAVPLDVAPAYGADAAICVSDRAVVVWPGA